MNSKTTLPISEARSKIFEIARGVKKPGVYYTLTENGKPTIVMMNIEEFEGWKETVDILKDFPNIVREIKNAEKDFQKGKYVDLAEYLKKTGNIKLLKKYEDLRGKSSSKSTKKS